MALWQQQNFSIRRVAAHVSRMSSKTDPSMYLQLAGKKHLRCSMMDVRKPFPDWWINRMHMKFYLKWSTLSSHFLFALFKSLSRRTKLHFVEDQKRNRFCICLSILSEMKVIQFNILAQKLPLPTVIEKKIELVLDSRLSFRWT